MKNIAFPSCMKKISVLILFFFGFIWNTTGSPETVNSQVPNSGISSPYAENFDGVTAPALPAGWSSIALPQGTIAIPARTIVRAWATSPPNLVELLSTVGSNESDLLLISPELENINQSLIRFYAGTSTSQGSPTLIVGTMSDPTDPSTFVEIRRFDDLSYASLEPYLVGLLGAPANARHIAFRHGNAKLGDYKSIYLDDFVFKALTGCIEPSGLKGTGISPATANIRWDENGTAIQWEVKYGYSGFNPFVGGASIMVNGNTEYLLEGLDTSTKYDFYVRAICSETEKSPWAGPALFRTTQNPVTAPFIETFEEQSAGQWDIENGAFENQWCIGNATSYEGTTSAYISNDGGTSNRYTLTPSATNRVHLFRDITFPEAPGIYTLKYRVKGMGQLNDYLRVFFCETSMVPVAGEFLPNGQYIGEPQIYGNADWIEKTIELPDELAGLTRRLVFSWNCNTSGGTQPPTAIDNIQILFDAYGAFNGTVRDVNGNLVSGAKIKSGEYEATTDDQGIFSINKIPDGTYYFEIEAGGMATLFSEVTINSGEIFSTEFQFEYANVSLPVTLAFQADVTGELAFQASATDGRYFYTPISANALNVFDLADPSSPQPVNSENITETGGAYYHQNLFVGSQSDRIEVFDCSNPLNLQKTATWFVYGKAKEMAFGGNYAYVIANQTGVQSILRVADCTDPANVNEVYATTLNFGDWAKMVVDTSRNLLYILGVQDNNSALFTIFDCSDPTSFNQLFSKTIASQVQGMVLLDDKVLIAYVKNNRSYIDVYNTENQSNPQLILTQQLALAGNILEVSDFEGTILMYFLPLGEDYLKLLSFVYDQEQNKCLQGLSTDVRETWLNSRFVFLKEPIKQLKSQSVLTDNESIGQLKSQSVLTDDHYETVYAVACGSNYGITSGPIRIFKYTKKAGEQYTLTMSITPAEAEKDGCKVDPGVGIHPYPEVTIVPLNHTNSTNWVFKEWQGASGNSVTVDGDITVTGVFVEKPVLTVSGDKEKELICPCDLADYEGFYPAGSVTFTADDIDDWNVNGFTLEASGTADDYNDILKVKVTWLNNEYEVIGNYDMDNGTWKVDLNPALRIPKNSSSTARIYYDFDVPDDYASDSIRSFLWKTKNVRAIPLKYEEYVITGSARMDSLIAARIHTSGGYYFTHVYEIRDGGHKKQICNGDTVWVCAGTYESISTSYPYIEIGTAITLKSYSGRDKTILKDHRIGLDTDDITIDGFTFDQSGTNGSALNSDIYTNQNDEDAQNNRTNINICNNKFTSNSINNYAVDFTSDWSGSTFENISVNNNVFYNFKTSISLGYVEFSGLIVDNNELSFDSIQLNYTPRLLGYRHLRGIFLSGKTLISNNICPILGFSNYPTFQCYLVITSHLGDDLRGVEAIIRNNKNVVFNIENIEKLVISENENCRFCLKNTYLRNTDSTIFTNNTNTSLNLSYNTKMVTIKDNFFKDELTLFSCEKLLIEKNTVEKGEIRISCIKNGKIQENTIYNSSKSLGIGFRKNDGTSIEIFESQDFLVWKNVIQNVGTGISVINGKEIEIKENRIERAETGIDVENRDPENLYKIYPQTQDVLIWNNMIKNTLTGILVRDSKEIKIKENKIERTLTGINGDNLSNSIIQNNLLKDNGAEFKYGIYLKKSHNIDAICNSIFGSCTGFKAEACENMNCSNNYVTESNCLFTGLNLMQSSGVIAGNRISNNHGNGIAFSDGSSFLVQNNNIFDNNPYGLNNEQGTTTIDASGNYWGNENGPGNDAFSGNVEAGDWLASSVKLNVVFSGNEKYSPCGRVDSVMAFVQNLTEINDTVCISVSDSKGWHTGEETFNVQFDDSTGTSLYIPYEIPAGLLDSSLFTVTTRSHLDNNWQATRQIAVFSYHPVADSIVVLPDSVAFSTTDTIQFTTTVYDQQGNYLYPELEWQASLGIIDSAGGFCGKSQTGICSITAKAKSTSVSGQATVRIWEGSPVASALSIDPDSATLYTGEWLLFDITATDNLGFRVETSNLAWSASSGNVDDFGIFTADTLPGFVLISAADTINGFSDTACVTIIESDKVEVCQAPVLISPLYGDTLNNFDVTFEWQPDTEASYFVFELATDENFENPEEFIGVQENTYTQPGLEEGIAYYWHVKAVNEAGSGDWSETWQFEVETGDTTRVDVIPKAFTIDVFPNPVNELLTIQFEKIPQYTVIIELIDMNAQLHYAETTNISDSRIKQINMKNFASGIYLLRIKTEEGFFLKKVIKK